MLNTPEGIFLIDLFNLNTKDVQNIQYERDGKGDQIFRIQLAPDPLPCPQCGCTEPHVKNYVDKHINHSVLQDRRATLIYRARRYVCPVCRKTYYEYNPFVFGSQRISTAVVKNVLEDLKDSTETMSSVARRYGISPTSVASIFDEHVKQDRTALPEILCLDENYAFRSNDSKYICVLLDFITQEPVDILPSRRYDDLASYFGKITKEERENVKLISSDMYKPYRSIARNYFPQARLATDPFHVSKEFHRDMNNVRIRIMKGFRKDQEGQDKNYYLLKKFNWILFKDPAARDKKGLLFDPAREKEYNHKFQRYLNLYEIRDMILDINTELTEVYLLKLELSKFYRESTFQTAEKNLQELIPEFLTSSIAEMNAFGRTLVNWKEEIVNSFIIVKKEYKVNKADGKVMALDRRATQSIIENRNKRIKDIKYNANGYTNWPRFRNRVLYVLRKDATYHLFPLDVPWKKKKTGS